MKKLLAFGLVATLAGPVAVAGIVVDGVKDADYGAARAVQTVETSWGDNGNELNAAYAKLIGGRLYLMITGNVGTDFNKLNTFIDSKAGGENVLSGTPEYDFSNQSTNLAGVTFDAGFKADYHAFARHGGGTDFDFTFVDRQGGVNVTVPGTGGVTSDTLPKTGGTFATGSTSFWTNGGPTANPNGPIDAAFDNSNAAGIGGDPNNAADPVAAAAVMTGLEFSIDLLDLGIDINTALPTDEIKIAIYIGNGDYQWVSNQHLAGAPVGYGGGNQDPDMAALDGDQFFTLTLAEHVIPEPSTIGLAVLGLIGLFLAGRRNLRA